MKYENIEELMAEEGDWLLTVLKRFSIMSCKDADKHAENNQIGMAFLSKSDEEWALRFISNLKELGYNE